MKRVERDGAHYRGLAAVDTFLRAVSGGRRPGARRRQLPQVAISR